MDYVGLFCLGAFAGAIAALAFANDGVPRDWRAIGAYLFPAIFFAAMVTFVARLRLSPALGCFPFGLLVGLMWGSGATAFEKITTGNSTLKWVGWAHLGALALLLACAVPILSVPTFTWITGGSVPERLEVRRFA